MLDKLLEFFQGLFAVIAACAILGLILAFVAFGGAFLTIAGIVVGAGIVILLIAAGIYEWLTKPDGQ